MSAFPSPSAHRSSRSTGPQLLLACALCVALASFACSDTPTGTHVVDVVAPSTPALEDVPYDAMGSGKVLFQRIANISGPLEVDAVYLIDADAHQTTIALDSVFSPVLGPSLSPDAGRVAWLRFDQCYSVFVTDLTGGSPRRMSSFPCNTVGPPSWTPAGDGVVFAMRCPRSGIYQASLASGTPTRLPGTAGICCFDSIAPSRSPDGDLAFACAPQVLAASGNDSLAEVYRSTEPSVEMASPTWSPSGAELAFTEVVRDTIENSETGWGRIVRTVVKVLDWRTREVRDVVTVPGSGASEWLGADGAASVCWLAEGTKLVFSAPSAGIPDTDPLRAHLYVVNADGTDLIPLTSAADSYDYNVSCAP